MNRYGKTYNVFKRDHETHKLIDGEYTLPEIGYLAHCEWEFTEKLDGTNIRLIWQRGYGDMDIKGRSDQAQVHPELEWNIRQTLQLAACATELEKRDVDTVCIYGEGYGPGIQKVGQLYGPTKTFRAFDVWADGRFWTREGAAWMLDEVLGIPRVPVITTGPLAKGVGMVRKGFQSTFGEFFAEGLIARPMMTLTTPKGTRIQCKIKHRDLYEETT